MKLAPLLLAAAACTEVHRVSIDLGEEVPVGFQCVDDAGRPLAFRAVVDGVVAQANIVLDFIRLSGVPTCLPTGVSAWCQDHDCGPILSARVCQALPPVPLGGSVEEAAMNFRDIVAGLEGQLITDDAPAHEPVIVRLVATVQPCTELAATPSFDAADLVGCVVSCPVQLDGVEGDIFLGSPTFDSTCTEDLVIACAGL